MDAKGESVPVVHSLRFMTVLCCKFYRIREESPKELCFSSTRKKRASFVAQLVKKLPAMRET